MNRSRPTVRGPFTNAMAGTLNLLPRAYVGGMLKHIDFLASNVPGIRSPLYLTGAKVDSFYGFGPTIGAALNITLMSYCGTCYVGVTIDTGAVTERDVLMDCLAEGFDEVLAVGNRTGRVVLPGRTDSPITSAGNETSARLPPAHLRGSRVGAPGYVGCMSGVIDVWMQHPTVRLANDEMFEPLRRWMGVDTISSEFPLLSNSQSRPWTPAVSRPVCCPPGTDPKAP